MKTRQLSLLVAIPMALLVLRSDAAFAAVGQPQSHGAHGTELPLIADGSKSPESIPDDLAYRHFLTAMALTDNPTREEITVIQTFVGRIGLSKEDQASFISGLTGLKPVFEQMRTVRTVALASQPTALDVDDLKRQEGQQLANIRLTIQNRLSFDGRQRLDKHIKEHVKRHIKIYGQ